jgi:hypothetical protein
VAKKSTNAEVQLRINEVYGLLTRGYSRAQVLQHAADLWGCSVRQADTYIARAREILEQDCEMSRPAFLAEALARLRLLEQRAEKRGQLQVAINSVRLQTELVGLTK